MKRSLQKYVEQHAPRKNASKLLPFYSEMKAMREQGYSFRQISEALQENDIKAYPSEIKRFMDRRNNQKGLEFNRLGDEINVFNQKDYKDKFFAKFENKDE
jgi:hypothetical protein